MKKLISLSLLILCVLHASFILSMMPNDERVVEFNRLVEADKENIVQLLGYDPQVEMAHSDSDKNRCAIPCLYLQGWPAPREDFLESIREDYDVDFPCPGIGFNFPDSQAIEFPLDLMKSSFGQISDMEPALYVLNLARKAGFPAVNIFAHSRGAATAVNLVAELKCGRHKKELEKLDIDEQARQQMLEMVQRGQILLNAPLKSIPIVLQSIVRNIRERVTAACLYPLLKKKNKRGFLMRNVCNISSSLGRVSDKCIAAGIHYVALPLLTRYKPWGDQAFSSVDKLSGLNLKTVLHYVNNDRCVSNDADDEFAQKLVTHNPATTRLFKSEEKYNHNGFSFLDVIRDFWKNSSEFFAMDFDEFRQD